MVLVVPQTLTWREKVYMEIATLVISLLSGVVVLGTAVVGYLKVWRPGKLTSGRLETVEGVLDLWKSRVDVLESTLEATRVELEQAKADIQECMRDRAQLTRQNVEMMRRLTKLDNNET